MRFQKIYVEISNLCNLKCSFCPGTKRPGRRMSVAEFSALMRWIIHLFVPSPASISTTVISPEYIPEELGLLTDLALFHINSYRFCGTLPHKFEHLKLLFELDISNNRFAGKFPRVVLRLPSLKFLDLRFNEFEGSVPSELFDKDLDAISW